MTESRTSLRALAGARAHAREQRPGFLARDEPLAPGDSGWQLLVGDETPAELDDDAGIVLVPLEALVERWPELREVLDAGEVGSEWLWDAATSSYVRREDAGLG